MKKYIITIVILLFITLFPFNKVTMYVEAETTDIPVATEQLGTHTYALYDISSTWNEAKEMCEDFGGHLITVTSDEEQKIVDSLIINGTKNSYWMGGFKVNGKMQWITDEDFNYSNWSYWQPDNYTGNENALMVYRNKNPNNKTDVGEWNDLCEDGTCNRESFFGKENLGFICEFETVDSNSQYNTSTESILGYNNFKDFLINYFDKKITSDFSDFKYIVSGLEDKSYIIPGINQTNMDKGSDVCHTMVPQGFCIAGEYALISAYCASGEHKEAREEDNNKTHDSVIYVIDKITGRYICTIVLGKNSIHAGALSYDENIIYIADSSHSCILKLPYEEVKKAIKSGKDSYTVFLKTENKIPLNDMKPSFLCCYNHQLYVGHFDKKYEQYNYMNIYDKEGNVILSNMKLPLQTQGIAFVTHKGCTYLIASCSNGRKNVSKMRVYKICGNTKDTFINLYDKGKDKIFPNMSEDIQISGDVLYTCFESAASYYRKGLDNINNKSENQIDRVTASSVVRLINEQTYFISKLSNDNQYEDVINSGECGDNMTYTLYSDGSMDISGEGDMYEYGKGMFPWSDYSDKISEISIGAGIDTISSYAFSNCNNLKSIYLTDMSAESGLFSIGEYAFSECYSLATVSLPVREYFIYDNTFENSTAVLEMQSDSEYIQQYCKYNNILFHAHNYIYRETIEATCCCSGYDEYICECGKTDIRNINNTYVAHDYELVTDIASTYEEKGIKGYQCKECGTYYEEETDVLIKEEEKNNTVTDNPRDNVNNTDNESNISKDVAFSNKKVKKPGKVVNLALFIKGKKLEVFWRRKLNVSGYRLQYAQNRKFTKKKKTVTVGKNKINKTIEKVKRGKTYYVRIRAYRKASGKKVYGKWSKVKKIKIKK